MSVVLLVRHGQASFGSGDYDRLSPAGECQSRLLGRALAEQDVTPVRVCVNAAVTKIVVGRHGMSLVSFNEHGHLTPESVTYR